MLSEAGFTFVEVLMASVVLMVGLLGIVSMVDAANRGTQLNQSREAATGLLRQLAEGARSLPFVQITPAGLDDALEALPGLGSWPSASGYQVKRRGTLFAVATSVCIVDDPADGLGSHSGATYCAGSGSGGSTTDTSPQDYKRVTLTITWGARRRDQTVLIPNPGSAAAPSLTSLDLTGGLSAVVTSALGSLPFTAVPSAPPAAISWTLDGKSMGSATGSGVGGWSFSWPLGTPGGANSVTDGTYLVGARALDAAGTSGAERELTITLNRSAPVAPTGVAAGHGISGVDVEWLPNPEGDVVGYRAFRRTPAGSWQTACPLSVQTSCTDTSAPGSVALEYEVIAYDRDAQGATRAGAASSIQSVGLLNNPPTIPPTLQGTTSGNDTTLTWTGSTDPDSGDSVDFYRVYRDGTTPADRYDRSGLGTDRSWTDTATGGQRHQYWISAVDTQLGESPLAGPVTV
jgi:hypothetical protein